MKAEILARVLIVVCSLALLVPIMVNIPGSSDKMVLTGNLPEKGGWQPGVIKAKAGESLKLNLTSNDVVHGFAIGKIEHAKADVYPGKFTDVTVTINEPGTYTYYCTRWCGPNHWRMRGTIEVEGDEYLFDENTTQPLYLRMGFDIDSAHEAVEIPTTTPIALSGEKFYKLLPTQYFKPDYYFSHSPSEIFINLRKEPTLSKLDDESIWELVAGLFWHNTSKGDLAIGQQLYAENCAACHGLSGDGNGVFAQAEEHLEPPTDFSDPNIMLGASPALLQGKIIRGGMGTGMPYWGTIFTEDETWALVDYLWLFQFQYPYGNKGVNYVKEK